MSTMNKVKSSLLHQKQADEEPVFPTNFLWGAATSAYQIEGAVDEDGRGPSIWDCFAATPGATYQGHTGKIAADHYHRMHDDVALMAELGLGAYRFSIAWPRIMPNGTRAINMRGLDFYDRLIDALLARGITPLATLYHWDLPLELELNGGWLNRETAYAFADYAEVVARRLGDRIDWWLTLNEPWCASFLGYGIGVHAPGQRCLQAASMAAHHLLLAHGLAVPRIRQHIRKTAQVGITLNLGPIYPADDSAETAQAAARADAFVNRWFLDPLFFGRYPYGLFGEKAIPAPRVESDDFAIIQAPIDFLGVNYYSRKVVHAPDTADSLKVALGFDEVAQVPGAAYTSMGAGWEVYPDGLTDLLVRLKRDYGPRAIIITENGAAFDDCWDGGCQINDVQRLAYVRDHIHALGRALAQNVPVRGYFLWSLLDNFEWGEGYSKRFGMVYVDYETQRRIVKASGRWYGNFVSAQYARQPWPPLFVTA
ncbi:MAG TPA: GH1 family beta-glucosidase [Ktedonobacterales bacterium]|nr:GH1 family beta-glucosidase [Ktedonobacterales bacterium]